ncbi:MAG: PcfB family protein [Clostridia bacterium]
MSISSESAEQTIKLILDGTVVVAKISGMAVKNIAVALYTISQDQKQTKGKTRLNNMLKSDNELKIFSIKKEDLKTFYQEAKSYGILYCALINRRNKNIDGMVDIMVRAKDAPQVNRIVERYINLATFDKASIQTEIEKERETTTKAKDISDNVPDLGEERTEVNEDMVEDIFAKPKENVNQNPEAASTEKSPCQSFP